MEKVKKSRLFWGIMAGFFAIFTLIVLLNVMLIHTTESKNIDAEGQIELSNIAGSVESNLYRSECLLDSVIMQVEAMLAREDSVEDDLRNFFDADTLSTISEKSDGSCFNAYAAYDGNLYINNFIPDENFVLNEREWYTGARRKMGKVNVSDPYIDANTGEMCYSISKLLSDGQTVVGLDFSMNELQTYIEEMNETSKGRSLIVNEQGMILGHSIPEYVGKNYKDLPFYNELVNKVYMLYGNFFEYSAEGIRYNVFSDKTDYDWYLIVCVKRQALRWGLGFGAILIIGMMAALMFAGMGFVYRLNRRKEQTQHQLQIQNRKLEDMQSQMHQTFSQLKNQTELLENEEFSDVKLKSVAMEAVAKLGLAMEQLEINADNSDKDARAKAQKIYKKKSVANVNYKKINFLITGILIATSIFAIIFNTNTQMKWGKTKMQKESDQYLYQVQEWITSNSATLEVIAHSISAQPGFEEDYNYAITYLDDIVSQYDDISVAYLCNPEWEHTVLMNNGWEPDDNWHVEERQWYVDTMARNDGVSIATPYLDEQTGLYCITLSEIVYDSNGDFIGVLGIDYYLDKLVDILGKSYTDTGYAFLTDVDGNILNHPYDKYQMKPDESQNAVNLCYRTALAGDGAYVIQDYDGTYKVCQAVTEKELGFGIIVVRNVMEIYGNAMLSDLLYVCVFLLCIILICLIMRKLSIWQQRVNMELKEAADRAISADRAKNDFLANMSHEIRTPINAVLGMNEMIIRESGEKEILEYAANIQGAGRTLLSLINDILDFSKIESGKMEIIPAQYDVSSMINDLVQMIRLRAEKKNLEFFVEIDSNIPETLYGDDVRVRQIITNILTNAVKYTAQGSIRLQMSLLSRQEDTAQLKISVADTGMGIREEDLDKLFQSFQRLDEQKNRNIEGTGLGITIVQRLLQMMGSRLEVSSVYGEGSTFSFVMEQRVIGEAVIGDYEARYKASTVPQAQEIIRTASQAHVLVVDDNETNLLVAKSLLKRTRVQTDLASSGAECIEKLQTQNYHIVFLDHMMPKMDGIETLRKIKEKNLAKDTIFVALTANAIRGAKENYLACGFDDYLSKPISGKNLEKCLFQYIAAELVEEELENHEIHQEVPHEKQKKSGTYINHATGLMYVGGSEADYQDILASYVSHGEENRKHLQQLYDNRDWAAYVIAVHALKSSSLSVGAEQLSEQAKGLELEGKNENYDYILENHTFMMELYEKVLVEGKEYLLQHTPEGAEQQKSLETQKTQKQQGAQDNIVSEPITDTATHTKEELREVLLRLREACDAFYSEDVLQICEELQAYLSCSPELSTFLEEVKKCADEFDFSDASEKTNQFINEHL